MVDFIDQLRAQVHVQAKSLRQDDIALIETSCDLRVIVDKKLAKKIDQHRWYAVISGGNHIDLLP